jgi:hypothetical protein
MEAKSFLGEMARVFEATPERWTHGAFARDQQGVAVDTLAPDAHSFSVNGFFERAVGEGLISEEERAQAWDLFLGAVLKRHGIREAVTVNDQHGREAIVSCLKQAAQ